MQTNSPLTCDQTSSSSSVTAWCWGIGILMLISLMMLGWKFLSSVVSGMPIDLPHASLRRRSSTSDAKLASAESIYGLAA